MTVTSSVHVTSVKVGKVHLEEGGDGAGRLLGGLVGGAPPHLGHQQLGAGLGEGPRIRELLRDNVGRHRVEYLKYFYNSPKYFYMISVDTLQKSGSMAYSLASFSAWARGWVGEENSE